MNQPASLRVPLSRTLIKNLRAFAGCVVYSLLASNVFASGNHHSAPMGGRSALMGGTGVALGADGAAPFLNPATITRVSGGRLAFSSRFYRFSQHRLKDFHTPGPIDPTFGDLRFTDTTEVDHRLHSVPDSVCYFFPSVPGLSLRQKLSLCLTTLEEQELSLSALGYRGSSGAFRLNQNQSFDESWSRFNLGPTWGVFLNEDLAVGGSLLVAFTRYQHAILGSSVLEDTTDGAVTTSSFESVVSAASWDLTARLGATYALSRHVTLGASVTLPLFHLFGSIRETFLDESDTSRLQWSGSGAFNAIPPLEFRVGVGGEWESIRFEFDTFLTAGKSEYAHGEMDREQVSVEAGQIITRDTSTLTVNESSRTVLNVALGAELFVGQRLSVLTGAQTDLNALRDLEPSTGENRLFKTKLHYFRAGAGICSYTDFGDLMAGLRFDFGTGTAAPVNTLALPPQLGRADVRELGVMLVLAGSVNWGSISQAVGELGEVVRGTSRPPPKRPPPPLQKPRLE